MTKGTPANISQLVKDANNKSSWKIRLFCPKCKLTHIVDVEKLEIIIKNSEKQTF